jgi:hypothetical protein
MKITATYLGTSLGAFVVFILTTLQVFAQSDREIEKATLTALGLQYGTAAELYLNLKEEAGDGNRLSPDELPDWAGLYSRDFTQGIFFDQEQQGLYPDIKLTPEFRAKLERKVEAASQNIEYDPISGCFPPGHPRWLTSPFLREHIIASDQVLLMSEVTNSTRRVYTDGRGHPPPEERYPLYNGDSIGFWDNDKLVVHTNQLMSGQYTRSQPDYTEEIETVEIWQKLDDRRLVVDIWVYDPPALLEPWYSRHVYYKVDNPDHSLRIRYWHCQENLNNAVYQTEGGASQFTGFNFNGDKDAESTVEDSEQ